jgi:hypothetical protein
MRRLMATMIPLEATTLRLEIGSIEAPNSPGQKIELSEAHDSA